ncbi:putative quinol monooxygenase [Cesiribacter sp. SM1]|uniref:putative quinol monooxygenase n=1 Tax=Cesiribacter sp. SM1 TaxID=2861196 RepID=UPI001CD36C9A|nr:antibiotic biosynthesis monooxygenase [Cesiribacter sp. SM1]
METALVNLKAKDNQNAEHLKNALLHLKKLSQDEMGMVHYEVFQSKEDPLIYYVRESWSSQDMLNRHLEQPHLQKFVRDTQEWLTAPFTSTLLREVF